MASVTFDTLRFVDRLEKAGLSREQASAIAEAQKDALSESLDSTLCTRSDLLEAKNEIRLEVASLRGEMQSVKWMLGALVALALANFGKQFF